MLRLYPDTRQLIVDGYPINLSPSELKIIQALQAKPGEFVPSNDLAFKVYGTAEKAYSNSLRAAIYTLREKIRITGGRSFIKSKTSKGYMLEVDHAE